MAHLPVQCQNCGARYKIPDTFKSDKAKCKACGTMIDVAAVRDAGDADAEATPKPKATHASGGTRKPRQTGAGSSRRGDKEVGDEKVKAPVGVRSSRRRGRGGDDADDGGEEGGRHHYEKKKDNTPMIASIVIVGLAVVAGVFWMVFDPFAEPIEDVAAKTNAEAGEGDAAKGDAAKENADDTDSNVKAAEGDAKKADPTEAEAAIAKKKAAAKKARPKTKRAQNIKADEDVKHPDDVFKPASVLKELPRPEGLEDGTFDEINAALEDIKDGSGLAAIRAPKKLREVGVQVIPIATNTLLALDYTKYEANDYAYRLGKIIYGITEFGMGWEPVNAGEDPDLKVANRNAGRVWDLHVMARLYWHSKDKFEAWDAKRPKK